MRLTWLSFTGLLCLTACSASSAELNPDADVDANVGGKTPADEDSGRDATADGTVGPDGSTGSKDAGSDFTPITYPDGAVVFPTNEDGAVLCGAHVCACNDGEDNDGDGLVDGFDPECTGAYDDDEGSFATGIPGDNKDPFQDCFFDGNSGNSEGDCMIPTSCILDRESQECEDGIKGQRTLEGEEMKCESFCEPRTPNGCDCFGCCTVHTSDTQTANVLLDPDCEIELDADGHAVVGSGCQSCTVSPLCGNECGECELCIGRRAEDLPDRCMPKPPEDGGVPDGGSDPDAGGGDPGYECLDGAGNEQPTCSTEEPCPSGSYCSQGCCVSFII